MIPRCMSFLAWIPEFEDKFGWPFLVDLYDNDDRGGCCAFFSKKKKS